MDLKFYTIDIIITHQCINHAKYFTIFNVCIFAFVNAVAFLEIIVIYYFSTLPCGLQDSPHFMVPFYEYRLLQNQGQAVAAGHKPIAMISSGQEAVDWSQYRSELTNWQVQARMSASLVDHYRILGCMNLSSKDTK